MGLDGRSANIPEEVEKWFEQDLITRDQYLRLRQRFTSDIWETVEYFFKIGLIDEKQYDELRLKYIPEEIERWFEEGIITKSQLNKLRSGYKRKIDQVLIELESSGDIDNEKRFRLENLYDIEHPDIGSMKAPQEDFLFIDEPQEDVPIVSEPEERELWPDDYGYEMKMEEFLESGGEKAADK